MSDHAIAVIPGDGIGIEVIREGQLTLETLAEVTGDLVWEFKTFPWGCEYYLAKNEMMPASLMSGAAGPDVFAIGIFFSILVSPPCRRSTSMLPKSPTRVLPNERRRCRTADSTSSPTRPALTVGLDCSRASQPTE